MRTLIYDYNNKNNALLMNIYNDNSINTMSIQNMELIQVYVKLIRDLISMKYVNPGNIVSFTQLH